MAAPPWTTHGTAQTLLATRSPRGVGVVRFDSKADLQRAVDENRIDLGLDHVGLVQEFIPARGGHITRVETLGGKYLYGIQVHLSGETFDLCPADICQTTLLTDSRFCAMRRDWRYPATAMAASASAAYTRNPPQAVAGATFIAKIDHKVVTAARGTKTPTNASRGVQLFRSRDGLISGGWSGMI